MVTVDVSLGDLLVELKGSDAAWSLRRHIHVPLDHVTAAHVSPPGDEPIGLRIGGTSIPGRISAGRFWQRGFGWSFCCFRRPDEVLVVDLRDKRYRKLVLEVDDPRALASRIEAARVPARSS